MKYILKEFEVFIKCLLKYQNCFFPVSHIQADLKQGEGEDSKTACRHVSTADHGGCLNEKQLARFNKLYKTVHSPTTDSLFSMKYTPRKQMIQKGNKET